jgi:biopolymer transport protein ExbD
MSMRFKRPESTPPELLLVPFIDILLVLLIFMALSATFSRYAQLQVELPQAQGQSVSPHTQSLWLQINAQGQVKLEGEFLGRVSSLELSSRMTAMVPPNQAPPALIIGADARTPHQSVVTAMEAARMAGLAQISFMSNAPPGKRP